MLDRFPPFPCTLLRSYPPEDLWEGYMVYGQCQPDGRVRLSEYCTHGGTHIGAAFESDARLGFHFSVSPAVLDLLPGHEGMSNFYPEPDAGMPGMDGVQATTSGNR